MSTKKEINSYGNNNFVYNIIIDNGRDNVSAR